MKVVSMVVKVPPAVAQVQLGSNLIIRLGPATHAWEQRHEQVWEAGRLLKYSGSRMQVPQGQGRQRPDKVGEHSVTRQRTPKHGN